MGWAAHSGAFKPGRACCSLGCLCVCGGGRGVHNEKGLDLPHPRLTAESESGASSRRVGPGPLGTQGLKTAAKGLCTAPSTTPSEKAETRVAEALKPTKDGHCRHPTSEFTSSPDEPTKGAEGGGGP